MKSRNLRIKLRANDHILLDQSTERIIEATEKHGAKVSRPIWFPIMRTHKRSIDILNPTAKTVDALMGLELPDGVDINIKLK